MNAISGRRLWGQLHAHAEAYSEAPTEKDKKTTLLFLKEWSHEVQVNSTNCSSCFRRWEGLVNRFPPDLDSRNTLINWAIAAHDWVNRDLGKPLHMPSISLQHPIFGVKRG